MISEDMFREKVTQLRCLLGDTSYKVVDRADWEYIKRVAPYRIKSYVQMKYRTVEDMQKMNVLWRKYRRIRGNIVEFIE